MPPTGYLSTAGVEACLVYLANTFPSITQLITLPESSVEGRTSRALKIASGTGATRDGVLFIGGVHARELINPDLLVNMALRMCVSYTTGGDIVYAARTWKAGTIKLLIDNLDIFVFPLVNPDGRSWVQNPSGYAMWRKNRRINAGSTCRGVDLNRNYDWLWSSGIGTSASPCSDVFRGSGAFSEPETRNVRWLLDTYANIECFVDVHSYSQLTLYPWGDDDNQTSQPSQNFQNPAWNGLRGALGSGYGEYISATEQNRFVNAGNLMRDAIADVRGRAYTVQEASDLYPTSGTSQDYAYSRHFVNASKRKVYGYTLETATEFQPVYTEANNVIKEASSGLLQFMVSCMCVLEGSTSVTLAADARTALRKFRDIELLSTRTGLRWLRALDRHGVEVLQLVESDERLREDAARVVADAAHVVELFTAGQRAEIDEKLAQRAERVIDTVREQASTDLAATLKDLRRDLRRLREQPLDKALEELDRAEE